MESVSQRVGHKHVRDWLLGRIQSGEFPVSSRLPPIRQTSAEMGVSFTTAHRAYRTLADEGVVTLARGRGQTATVVRFAPHPKTRPLVIGGLFRAFMERNQFDNLALEMYESACHALVAEQASIIPRKLSDPQACASLLRDIAEQGVSGVLLDEVTPDEMVSRVAAAGCPTVIYNRHVDGTSVGSVAPDFERMGRLLARKILHGGYERVVFWRQWRLECHEDPVDRARECNFAGYHDAVYGGLLACGLMEQQVVVLPEGGPDGRDRWGEASYVGEVLERLDLNRGPRTAFVTTSDRWALHLVETLRERGVEVPRRCGVIGRHNLEVNRTATRPVTTWETNPAEIGRVAAQMLLERIEFPDREQARRYVAQALVDHGTL